MQAADLGVETDILETKPMATIGRTSTAQGPEVDYPTSDGKPMGGSDLLRQVMMDLIQILQDRFAAGPNVYVSGDLLLYYEEGNPRRRVTPDVLVAFGVPKLPPRDYYLLWKEGKAPDVVIEMTCKRTRREDQKKKPVLYRDVLRVPEYFKFDPTEDYLKPSMQGHRLIEGQYLPIEPVEGRLPSRLLGLHPERHGTELRLYDPAAGRWLPTLLERIVEAKAARQQFNAETRQHEAETRRHETETRRHEAEIERLRRHIAQLERKSPEDTGD